MTTHAHRRAATDALERCRAHSEKSADRTTASVDAWLAERRRRWEAGKTRCEELAPPVAAGQGGNTGNTPDDAIGGVSNVPTGLGPAFAPHFAAAGCGDSQDTSMADMGWVEEGGEVGGRLCSLKRRSWPPWDWGKGGVNGASFDDFLETFAGGRAVEEEQEAVGQLPPVESAGATVVGGGR